MINIQEIVNGQAHRNWFERQRSGTPGTAEEDWYKAEKSLNLYQPHVEATAHSLWVVRKWWKIPGTSEQDWIRAQKIRLHHASPELLRDLDVDLNVIW